MTVLYIHLFWFFLLFIFFMMSLMLSLFVSFLNISIFFKFQMFNLWVYNFSVKLYLDFYSSWFMSVILLISSVIMIYSYNYMMPYSKSIYFLNLTFLFVFSMIIVVLFTDIFFIMLGWDGLGLVSFFLIVYYQNQSSITSGIFTLMMNRVGDSFFLITIIFFFNFVPTTFLFSSLFLNQLVLILMVLTFMTKSAIFPFSPWLPLAMAAPTPISALVHSSTLVTSGLYLMMRFSFFLYSFASLMNFLLILSVFTSFYAGMNCIFEMNFKKLIALSTLSHLGFIGLSFSLGLIHLAYFHMLTHALFKSLLFMCMGDIMVNMHHSQDSRYLSSGVVFTPFSSFVMNVSLFNLLGLPGLSGFYSKDLVLECLSFSNVSFFLLLIVFVNIFFTYYYSLKLLSYSFSVSKSSVFNVFHFSLLSHSFLMFLMSLFSLFFGKFFLLNIYLFMKFFPSVLFMKFFPSVMLSFFLLFILIFLTLPYKKNTFIFSFFSTMFFLSFLCLSFSSAYYLNFLYKWVKAYENGFSNYLMNKTFSNSVYFISNWLVTFMLKFNSFYLFVLIFFLIFFLF